MLQAITGAILAEEEMVRGLGRAGKGILGNEPQLCASPALCSYCQLAGPQCLGAGVVNPP